MLVWCTFKLLQLLVDLFVCLFACFLLLKFVLDIIIILTIVRSGFQQLQLHGMMKAISQQVNSIAIVINVSALVKNL